MHNTVWLVNFINVKFPMFRVTSMPLFSFLRLPHAMFLPSHRKPGMAQETETALRKGQRFSLKWLCSVLTAIRLQFWINLRLKLIHCKSDIFAGITCIGAYERVMTILLIVSSWERKKNPERYAIDCVLINFTKYLIIKKLS